MQLRRFAKKQQAATATGAAHGAAHLADFPGWTLDANGIDGLYYGERVQDVGASGWEESPAENRYPKGDGEDEESVFEENINGAMLHQLLMRRQGD